MTAARRPLTRGELEPLARAAAGPDRRLNAVTRLRGGSKKGVYRLTFDDGGTVVAYVWSPDEDYWTGTEGTAAPDPRDPFSHASGIDLFTAAHDRLAALGVRTPRLLLADRTGRHLPADAAVVEDVRGGTLEEALERDPGAAAGTLERLAGALETMRARVSGQAFGKVGVVEQGGTSHGASCVDVVRDRALRDIVEAAGRDARIAEAREALDERMHGLASAVRPRARHTLIHGELGPDHVLVGADGEPVLVDIEGLMYFDPEWEHVFLELRFGPHYDVLRAPGLDEDRLRLYRLAIRLSLVAGPLRLLDGDFPDREFMRTIAEHNLRQALTLLRNAS
ncbi:phosphotransferase family protein [Streptomyces sp. DSM 40750]|uniref:phosphotransferase family protein n=1 Tax=Streptomyces sp. DSM 40750 TaxID=2801030 RepID=UPI00214C6910|nr:aminoglycoside phosphotransferase family protein [Streptomyces sp. DSM 40750]UUU24715.1 aminoglycoside phosphotransferase family protein [Streptomyces sp. DSM 40750]